MGTKSTKVKSELALLGGPKAVQADTGDIFAWPIIDKEHEEAVLEVLRRGAMSGTDVTQQFEREYAEWHGLEFALAQSSGTSSLHAAMWACGVGVGSEIIAPSFTFWASILPALNLGASVVFAEVEPHSLCLDPADIEHRITRHTRAILPVHYCGYPADMDPIMDVARRHGLKVIEDVSHAHGGLYKGRMVGTIGNVGAMSLMSGKSFAIGEGGILITDEREIFERAAAFGHYERTGQPSNFSSIKGQITDPELQKFAGVPLGGFKYRMHQLSSAVARVQLRRYPEQLAEIQKAMNRFWDQLEGVPGIKAHRPAKDSGSTMGGWYAPHGLYEADELDGLPIEKFCEAVTAEGASTSPGANFPLHLHPVFQEADIYGHGKPTIIANADRDLRQPEGSLPITESMPRRCFWIPWFKHCRPEVVDEHAAAFRKVAERAEELADE